VVEKKMKKRIFFFYLKKIRVDYTRAKGPSVGPFAALLNLNSSKQTLIEIRMTADYSSKFSSISFSSLRLCIYIFCANCTPAA